VKHELNHGVVKLGDDGIGIGTISAIFAANRHKSASPALAIFESNG